MCVFYNSGVNVRQILDILIIKKKIKSLKEIKKTSTVYFKMKKAELKYSLLWLIINVLVTRQ